MMMMTPPSTSLTSLFSPSFSSSWKTTTMMMILLSYFALLLPYYYANGFLLLQQQRQQRQQQFSTTATTTTLLLLQRRTRRRRRNSSSCCCRQVLLPLSIITSSSSSSSSSSLQLSSSSADLGGGGGNNNNNEASASALATETAGGVGAVSKTTKTKTTKRKASNSSNNNASKEAKTTTGGNRKHKGRPGDIKGQVRRKTDDGLLPHSNHQQQQQKTNTKKKKYKKNRQKFSNNNKKKKKKNYNNNNPNSSSSTWSAPENRKLNQQIVQCDNANAILQFVASLKGVLSMYGGDGKLNSVNFSTSLHRLAKTLQYHNYNTNHNQNTRNNRRPNNQYQQNEINRSKILADPRFALLLCCSAEALASSLTLTTTVAGDGSSSDGSDGSGVGDEIQRLRDVTDKPITFHLREMSNIAWAIAKYNIAPPQHVLPIDIDPTRTQRKLIETSKNIRDQIYQVAKDRAAAAGAGGGSGQQPSTVWMKDVSKLCAYLVDHISARVMMMSSSTFQLQEYANLIWSLANNQRGHPKLFNFVIQSLIGNMKSSSSDDDNANAAALRPQEWSNSIWSLAKSEILDGNPEEQLLPFVANLMDDNLPSTFLDKFKPQELSNTAWGVANILNNKIISTTSSSSSSGVVDDDPTSDAALRILRQVAKQLIKRNGENFKSQELANTVWSFAKLGFGLSSSVYAVDNNNSKNDYVYLQSDDPIGDQQLMEDAIKVVITTIKSNNKLTVFKSQEINNLAWSLRRLEQNYDTEFLSMIGKEMCNPRRRVQPQDIGTTIWSLASMEFFDDEIYRGLAYRITPDHAANAKPQELSNLVWALATADIPPKFKDVFDTSLLKPNMRPTIQQAQQDPVTRAFGLTGRELMRRPHEFKTQEIKDILWSFSSNGIRHPELFRSVAEYLVGPGDSMEVTGRGMDDFSPQGFGNLAWAYAKQAQLGAETTKSDKGGTLVANNRGKLGQYTTIYIDVGESLLQKLFVTIAETDVRVHDNLSRLKPQDLANTVWAFAVLGLKHTRFLEAVVDQAIKRTQAFVKGRQDAYTRFKSQEIANTLWALAILNYVPTGVSLLTEIEPFLVDLATSTGKGDLSVQTISRNMKRQELANIAWVCAVFREYPPDLIQLLYQGLIGYGENTDPSYLAKMYRDGGIEQSAVMSLTYLQIVMDLDLGGSNTFHLPGGFPEKWESGRGNNNGMDDYVGMFDLKLTTSKIQMSVSDAFHRIGFGHVDEHAITMHEMAGDYGIQFAPNHQEILTLDIANVESKIGIEVDGPAHFISTIDYGNMATGDVSLIKGIYEYQFDWDYEKQEINGPTALKLWMLDQLGWRVVNVPFWEWYALNGDLQQQEEYCRSKLRSIE